MIKLFNRPRIREDKSFREKIVHAVIQMEMRKENTMDIPDVPELFLARSDSPEAKEENAISLYTTVVNRKEYEVRKKIKAAE